MTDAYADLEQTIDRIVDGDLSPAQLRESMVRLEASPDGWKRCTLAFLEAQSWGDAFREPRRSTAMLKTPEIQTPVVRPSASAWRLHPAMAASVALLCFSTGWLSGGRTFKTVKPPSDLPVQIQTAANDASPDVDAPKPPVVAAEAPPQPAPGIREIARLRIGGGPEGSPTADVPILDGPGLDPSWLMNQPMPVSAQEQAALQQQGYELDQKRRLVAMPLHDGRQVVVPIDSVSLRYVGTDSL